MNWNSFLKHEFEQTYFKTLSSKLTEAYAHSVVYPPKALVFNAFSYASYDDLKVVIVGQDPYHQAHQAHGLSFSVEDGVPLPPSLQNIFKELKDDCGCSNPSSGNLSAWAKQGVLLLNASLTVEEGKPMSHQDLGWSTFYEHVLQLCDAHPLPLVFILWGKHAQKAESFIHNPNHIILKAPHPSPLSAYHGFFGSKPFSTSNKILIERGRLPIDWCLK